MPGARREVVAATRDLLGVVRVLRAAAADPIAVDPMAAAEDAIEEAMNIFAVAEPDSVDYEVAVDRLRAAVSSVRATLPDGAELLGVAAKRVRGLQGRPW